MRVMAQRIGPAGRVLGIDTDDALGAAALATLHGAGHRNCDFLAHDLTAGGPVPGGPFDVVYARLLLFHLPQRVAVLARLWDAVAPGGHLIVQDYDIRTAGVLAGAGQRRRAAPGRHRRVQCGGLRRERGRPAGAAVRAGRRREPRRHRRGRPDRAAGQRPGATEGSFRSVLPAALAHGITTGTAAEAALAAIDRDAGRFPDRPMLWPLLIGAWKRKQLR